MTNTGQVYIRKRLSTVRPLPFYCRPPQRAPAPHGRFPPREHGTRTPRPGSSSPDSGHAPVLRQTSPSPGEEHSRPIRGFPSRPVRAGNGQWGASTWGEEFEAVNGRQLVLVGRSGRRIVAQSEFVTLARHHGGRWDPCGCGGRKGVWETGSLWLWGEKEHLGPLLLRQFRGVNGCTCCGRTRRQSLLEVPAVAVNAEGLGEGEKLVWKFINFRGGEAEEPADSWQDEICAGEVFGAGTSCAKKRGTNWNLCAGGGERVGQRMAAAGRISMPFWAALARGAVEGTARARGAARAGGRWLGLANQGRGCGRPLWGTGLAARAGSRSLGAANEGRGCGRRRWRARRAARVSGGICGGGAEAVEFR